MSVAPLSLPPQSTPFVGRQQELADIAALLADSTCRLLTLLGPGGIGKSRLAIEAAVQQPAYPNGVYFVWFQSLTSPDQIVSAIAESLGFAFYGQADPVQQLLHYLREKALLLVLDNFEHLLGGASLVSVMLTAAPQVKLLVTSREVLNLQEEWLYPVKGMPYPKGEHTQPIEDYGAVRLFVQNARRAQPGFSLTDEQEPVIRICQLVEGMPLGIELAAAWLRRLPASEIAREIERGLDILENPARNVPERHQSMRAVLEHSWKLLSEAEQAVFQKLAVFRGGFRREAAEAVTGATLRTLSALVDKSLLRVDANGRYDLHELVRQFAEDRLRASGEADAVRDRHSAYYLDFLAVREADIKGRRQLPALNEIRADADNVRAAWGRALEHKEAEPVRRTLEAVHDFYDMTSGQWQGKELLLEAQAVFDPGFGDPPGLLWAHIAARAVRLDVQGPRHQSIPEALAQIERCLGIATTCHDQSLSALCLSIQGWLFHIAGEDRRALALSEESLKFYRDLDDLFHTADQLHFNGFSLLSLSQDAEAIECLEQAARQQLDMGNRYHAAWSFSQLGQTFLRTKRYVEADRYIQTSAAIFHDYSDPKGIGWCERLEGEIALSMGEFEKANILLNRVLKRAADTEVWEHMLGALRTLTLLAALQGDYEGVQRLYVELLSVSGDIPPLELCIAAYCLGQLEQCQQYLCARLLNLLVEQDVKRLVNSIVVAALLVAHEGAKEYAVELLGSAFNHPTAITGWMEKWSLLTRLRADLEGEMGAEAYCAAWERGKTLDLEATVRALLAHWNVAIEESASVPPGVAAPLLADALSERELEILRLIAEGQSNREIADQLVVAVSTVKWYINEMYSKLGVDSRTRAIARARVLKLIP
jgi:predicted ATPase/DNA-binding CsgD family transcriptional regulator